MAVTALSPKPHGLALMLSWQRVLFTVLFSSAIGLMLGKHTKLGAMSGVVCVGLLGLTVMLVFGLFEQWPRRLPRWLARWFLQVIAVTVVIPPAMAFIFFAATPTGPAASDHAVGARTGATTFLAPRAAPTAIVPQHD